MAARSGGDALSRAGLRAAAQAQSERTGHSIRVWETYAFQFQGVAEGGRRLALINAFYEPPREDVATRWFA